MGRAADAPWEIWAIIIGVISIVAIPIIVGTVVVRIYRVISPIEPPNEESAAILDDSGRDGFFKILLVGWIICGVACYILYKLHLFDPLFT